MNEKLKKKRVLMKSSQNRQMMKQKIFGTTLRVKTRKALEGNSLALAYTYI
jgi:hypothetical protein